MVSAFDRILLAVPDLSVAVEQYSALTGAKPWVSVAADGSPTAWLGMANTVVELVERPEAVPGLCGVVFNAADSGAGVTACENALALELGLCDGTASAAFRGQHPESQVDRFKVDHLVLRTGDAEACIKLFRDELGIRLALDQTVADWGGRMLFFRAGKLTLEVIQAEGEKSAPEGFWGIAYQCEDIDVVVAELTGSGVDVSEVREGRKPGTRVATVKSSCLGVPTLLLASVR